MSIAKQLLKLLAVCGFVLTGCEAETGEEITPEDFETEIEAVDLDGWDTDDDGLLDENEFRQIGYYEIWNTDRRDELTEEELETGFVNALLFEEWDVNGDGLIGEGEFRFADEAWFETWDADDDGTLDEHEFYGGIFATWDIDDDGLIDEEEFYGGLYDSWDINESGYIEEAEYTIGSNWFE